MEGKRASKLAGIRVSERLRPKNRSRSLCGLWVGFNYNSNIKIAAIITRETRARLTLTGMLAVDVFSTKLLLF